ncbi:TPA: penicillin-binding protein 2 [Campylobacter fetus subsp. venerealis]|uniref:Penicillin-binding protein 2 n=3 Tax=Campylobacter fetus TaxID=196 RepID=A0A5L4IYH3_CAMFE|nr:MULTISPECIES: penicillin-binding protein 2 [Campylobacter]OCS22387.1 penicillin-binding protein [Campylobacter fetus subsp. venerealis cfvi97/532]OCS25950.1 penicillin-binding protein [Campylobacter fetus subsp. venerealis cfvB10]OCS29603.1 penicillin-binding protein [Campylobacter fetus subsp. venerealis LMG 6570 = CCUG 33900]OCS42720.1 penicillin-binding protein [Campylobacter fetus subsp. venerealis cfvi02/298]AHE93990.1 cell division protein FtsI / penicillin-binding protein [Campylobac
MSGYQSQSKIYVIFSFIVLGIILFLFVIFYRALLDRKLPKLQSSDFDSALRGSIISKDGFSIASSQKLYKAMVDTRNIDPNKKELFIKLYTLYSGDDPTKIRKILSKKGVVTLSYEIDAKGAAYLKELARKLYKKKVFIAYQDPKTGIVATQGMSIVESGEKRIYMAEDTLTPAIGYIKKIEQDGITKVEGVKGIEKVYDNLLSSTQDAITKGPRDLSNTIILSGDAELSKRIDGYNVVLNTPLKLQKVIEQMATQKLNDLIAKEVVIGVMESKTGKIIALVSTSRYNPSNITINDYQSLNSTASEYAYEVGSVMKPVIFSLLLRENKVNPLEIINTYGGKYKLGQRTITDSHKNDFLSAEDIIVESSNVGMIQLVERLSEIDLYNGLLDFGFSKKTGVDLSYEQVGLLPSINELRNKTYKSTVSYGYGLQATFMQLLNAYNTINNNGVMITPQIASHLEKNGKIYAIKEQDIKTILPIETAKIMKRILIKVVESNKGTARKARIQGLSIGGKTGTAHIATSGGYSDKRYNASFFGFVNDISGNNYTIGVLVREPMKPYPYYYASWSALPIFKNTVELMVENGYLKPAIASPKIDQNEQDNRDILD